ncbi:phosphomannomutase/phosphoglucomutase [Candidatus Falkowbacteria bacterium CG11_big_fil_rev_8_21_14_0_20_39_10]|uniref:Phosphomannomutase/phosphoglucomutase n=1 Tax=Candidatus Falkowbacteria bacterium CG11_big_fil_rev_8_21_14_0_20_39_10 TaxID=1974570 RepID=A0A2M6K8J5_9BACT|nr:MAG: phosphomannomutase/phosphoglucomutase [Candidatus Falkowbacteria bacterium CG11_big_fil_rev_8_21_14_0_20_39_10]
MKINPEIFKAYDIRGIYGQDFDDETAYKLGLAYSLFRKKEVKKKKKLRIVVGEDMRLSSPALKKKLIKGLADGGVDVIDIGLASTPTFYFSVAKYACDGGINVTASHNPRQYNGFKLVRGQARPIGKNTGIYDLRDLVIKGKLLPAKNKGKVIKNKTAIKDQAKHDLTFADAKKIKPFKIIIDTANSMGATYFEELFKHLKCKIIKMNWKLDGAFPSHEADPFKPENTKELRKKVVSQKADLGIATDGDGDRIFFVDNKGKLIEPGIIRAILSKIFLKEKPGAKIAYDIRPGKITEDTILENGGIPIITPVGHSLIKDQAIREGAYFAGESSGHYFVKMKFGFFEAPMIITLKILEDLSISGLSFADYIKPYQKYFHSGEINTRVKNPEAIIKKIKQKYKDGQQNYLDRISVEYPDYWFNIRTSNTEPLLRFNLEARTKKLMQEKRDEVLKIIKG